MSDRKGRAVAHKTEESLNTSSESPGRVYGLVFSFECLHMRQAQQYLQIPSQFILLLISVVRSKSMFSFTLVVSEADICTGAAAAALPEAAKSSCRSFYTFICLTNISTGTLAKVVSSRS